MSEILYFMLVLATGGERIVELIVSKRNATWSFERGGIEFGRRHFPPMVALHTGLLLACMGEVYMFNSPFISWLGWPMLALVVASQGLRWWCIASLGPRWNTRVIVVGDLPLVMKGPYRWRWLRHPNYVAVVVEGFALPLVHSAWVTAVVFTVLNAILLLAVRIPSENKALATIST